MSKIKALENKLNRSGWFAKRWGEGQDTDRGRKECNKEIAKLIAEMVGYEEEELG